MAVHGEAALEVRRGSAGDVPSILELASRALGWEGDADDSAFFRWKHFENPAGTSPMWVAVAGERVVGLRTFLRWPLRDGRGAAVSAVRAVDTATDPEYQGRGVFTRLTLGAISELGGDGVQLVFNTPNAKSLPGYRKMGWSVLGRLRVAARVTRARSVPRLFSAHRPAGRASIETTLGVPATELLLDRGPIERLLASQPVPSGLATVRSPEHLAWRYGHDALGYRVVLSTASPADGLAIFRLRRRGRAVEAAVCDVVTPGADPAIGRLLINEIAHGSSADYLLRIGGPIVTPGWFVRVPRAGPVLACRRLDGDPTPALADWELGLGDIELL